MTILHVVEPFAAGIAVFVKSLTETMPDDVHIIVHGERKHEIAASEVKKIFPQKNIRFIKWRSAQRSVHPLKDFMALSELYKIIRRLKKKDLVDAVHLHSSKSGLLGRVACRMAGIENVVYTPNGAPFLSGRSKLANYFYQQLEKLGHGFGGKVVCCSQSEQKQYHRIGIAATFVNNGIAVQAPAAHAALPLTRPRFRIITSGRIVTQKNPALFNSIASYFQEFEDFEFIWAGDGDSRAVLSAPNIKVTGWMTPEEVRMLVTSADVYLSTSVYEGLSFAVLEALALKKPMLLSDCVGNSDVIKSGRNGDLFKGETEAIIKILSYYIITNTSIMLRKLLTEDRTAEANPQAEDLYRSIKVIQQKLEEEMAGKQRIIEESWLEIKKLRNTVQEKSGTIQKLEACVAEAQRNNEGNRQIINKLLNDLDRMQQDIEWYKRTYENRSLLGVVKDKVKAVFANHK